MVLVCIGGFVENLRLSWCGRIVTVGVEAYGVVTLDGFATDLNVFATIKLDTRGCGKTACLHPVFLRSASLFGLQHFLGIEEQMINFFTSLSNFFYWVDLESIEDVGFVSLGIDDELDLIVPSNELFMLVEHRV